jgi:hypothetical protein
MLRPGHFFRHEKTAEVITNHPVILTVVVCIAWTLFGLVGHDPWKSEEAVFMGHLSQLRNANFYFGLLDLEEIPLAGPLFYAVSLGSIDIFSPLLAAHDAARLTMAIWLLSAFLFVGLTGNELWGRSQSWLAPLLLLGSVGPHSKISSDFGGSSTYGRIIDFLLWPLHSSTLINHRRFMAWYRYINHPSRNSSTKCTYPNRHHCFNCARQFSLSRT